MAGSGAKQPNKPNPPRQPNKDSESSRKPLQVLHITRKEQKKDNSQEKNGLGENSKRAQTRPNKTYFDQNQSFKATDEPNNLIPNATNTDVQEFSGMSMGDLLDRPSEASGNQAAEAPLENIFRSVDEFDFDEDAFLAALDENEPVGNTGEIASGKVIGVESDGIYVDIGGKAPGFMPKKECGLGVITNLKEKFPKGIELEVLVTKEQNADGIVTISCRALALRKSWEKVKELEKSGKVVQVKINGFNRGGVTGDLEGLRGFIPRSQLNEGENHETLVGKTLGVAFLEVNPDSRKLVLSEKRAAIALKFAQLEVGQLIEGKVLAVKPYGFFIDLGGISGLLHHSMVTNGTIKSLREIFRQGDLVKALIVELDQRRARISLNTALLEGPPGEIIQDKDKVMSEAHERAEKIKQSMKKKAKEAGSKEHE